MVRFTPQFFFVWFRFLKAHPLRTASELKIKKIQDSIIEPAGVLAENSRFGMGGEPGASAPVNEAADRALNSVARKLDKSLSVEYTVNELIAEATDTVNLATIYHGRSRSAESPHSPIEEYAFIRLEPRLLE